MVPNASDGPVARWPVKNGLIRVPDQLGAVGVVNLGPCGSGSVDWYPPMTMVEVPPDAQSVDVEDCDEEDPELAVDLDRAEAYLDSPPMEDGWMSPSPWEQAQAVAEAMQRPPEPPTVFSCFGKPPASLVWEGDIKHGFSLRAPHGPYFGTVCREPDGRWAVRLTVPEDLGYSNASPSAYASAEAAAEGLKDLAVRWLGSPGRLRGGLVLAPDKATGERLRRHIEKNSATTRVDAVATPEGVEFCEPGDSGEHDPIAVLADAAALRGRVGPAIEQAQREGRDYFVPELERLRNGLGEECGR